MLKLIKLRLKSNTVIKPPEIAKTFIVGSSILQKISTRGLSRHTTVKTYRGANTSHIRYHLENSNLNEFRNFIIQVGGNDASQNRDPELIECEFVNMIQIIRGTVPKAKIILSECTPRCDVNVNYVNSIIRRVANDYSVHVLQTNRRFMNKNGRMDYSLMSRDGIHLTSKGTATLLKLYNDTIPVLKENPTNESKRGTQYTCFNCGEAGHSMRSCRHRTKVQCWCCGLFGHKAKRLGFRPCMLGRTNCTIYKKFICMFK